MKRRTRLLAGYRALALLPMLIPAGVVSAASTAALKNQAVAGVTARAKLAQEINDSLFSFSELGFQEVETQRYLGDLLQKHGFTFERGTAGLPSGWVARWSNGTGGPTIALGSDVDGIPKASQMPGIPWRQPMVEGAPGHGEGHNSGQAVNIVAALAVQEIMKRDNIPGTLVIWPGIAEELLAGKAFYVREGVFKDVDAVLFTHVANNLGTSWGYSGGTGLVSVEYTFHGESAHSAGGPWRGRSALDGVELMTLGWEMRREHLRPEQRSHYVITDGGDQPNVVPSQASVWFFIREQTFENIDKNFKIANRIADAAAMMTDTTVTRRMRGSAAPQNFNRPLAEAASRNIKVVGLPRWTEEEQAFAKAVQKNIGAKEEGLATSLNELEAPPKEPRSGGSDDIGDVSWNVPTITIRYPANIPNLPGHNWANAIAMATPIAHKGVVAGSKVIAMTTIDLLTDKSLLPKVKAYFTDVTTKDEKYVPMLAATDEPTTEANAEVMGKYKEELKKLYYDPSRYDTYLDQLGIKFPTLEKTVVTTAR